MTWEAITAVSTALTGITIVVTTEDLCGGGVCTVWNRIVATIEESRAQQPYPMLLEWFQWLADQYERRGRMAQIPAHQKHRDWSPRPSGR